MENDQRIDQKAGVAAWLLLLFLSLVWGASFLLIKKSLIAYTPNEVAALRIGISFFAMLPVIILHWRKVPWDKWRPLLVVAFAGTGIPAFLFPLAETEISSSVAGILNSLTPLFALVIGVLAFRLEAGRNKFFAVLLGLGGAALLIFMGQDADTSGNSWYGLFIILGCIFYATSVNTVKRYFQDLSSIQLTATTFILIGPPALVYLLYADTYGKFQTEEEVWLSFAAVCILALAGTILASILFYRLVQMTNVVFSSMVAYLIPLTALLLGFFDGEPITIYHFLGMGLILIGVYLSRD